jgi:Fe-S-cluster-containing dehydrogenase component/DMSO reductase anchor subunit
MSVERAAVIRLPSLERLLAEQSETAVERFARQHARGEVGDHYRALLPQTAPGPGEQLAFEVDVDRCTGCKACVTGCHSLNGLDDGEVWRKVGLLHGGSASAPVQRTITSACHHCVDPACMNGCPVLAYEKDPITGIVKHLDDQCIGCKYCLFMCPYEAPKFNAERGIVRKCDMCSDRLRHDEAPACVQACPNEAIRITVVTQAVVAQEPFLPGAPTPRDTAPTTRYRATTPLAAELTAADFHALAPEPAHPPLVVMLTLTQAAVGVLAAELVRTVAGVASSRAAATAWAALAVCMVALGASALHLGRPVLAFRALLGVRRSWLSREVLAFGLFAAAAGAYALSFLAAYVPALAGAAAPAGAASLPVWVPPSLLAGAAPLLTRLAAAQPWSLALAVVAGLAGVYTSVMVYAATRRPCWSGARTAARFGGSVVVLGIASTLAVAGGGRALAAALAVAVAAKLAVELIGLRRRGLDDALGRSAALVRGPLAAIALARFGSAALGGIVLPLAMTVLPASPTAAAAALACVLVGELLERHLFFIAAPTPRMPGPPA